MKTKKAKRQFPLQQETSYEQRTTAQPWQKMLPHGTPYPPEAPTTGSPATGLQLGANPGAPESSDLGLSLFLDTLKVRRLQRKLSVKRLARMAAVPAEVISRLEAHDAESFTICDLLAVAKALEMRLAFLPVQRRPTLPSTNEEILAEFDRLVSKGKCNPFFRQQPDKEHPELLWDAVGDIDRNWLFVVASNPRKRVRFAKVTDNPGGWSIEGQIFGIDVETEVIAGELSDQLLKQHRSELI